MTNARGGVNLDFQVGDLMVIDDHINFYGRQPAHRRSNDAGFGPRFCDMTYAYTPALRRLADEVAEAAQGVALRHGDIWAIWAPATKTRRRSVRSARAARTPSGMSTVPEVIAASHCGLPSAGHQPFVTNMAAGVLERS